MFKININGVTREATAEEIAEMERLEEEDRKNYQPTQDERIRDLEEALDLLLSGRTE